MHKFASLLVFVCICGHSQDGRLNGLNATLEQLRTHSKEHLETRGATEQLTVAKHQLRDWIESQLTPLRSPGEVEALANRLNDELRQAKLTYEFKPAVNIEPGFWTETGYIGEVRLQLSDFLVVRTSVGIHCGEDDSGYIYEWTGERWRRRWQSEQNDYAEERYVPQKFADDFGFTSRSEN
jgi:hypothetical protein